MNAFGDIGTGWEEEGWVYRFRSVEEGGWEVGSARKNGRDGWVCVMR